MDSMDVFQAITEQLRTSNYHVGTLIINPNDFKRERQRMKSKRMVGRLKNR